MSSRLTAVQRDVIERLKDGWEVRGHRVGSCEMKKAGEAPRHIRTATIDSLDNRGVTAWRWDGRGWVWVLVEGAGARER